MLAEPSFSYYFLNTKEVFLIAKYYFGNLFQGQFLLSKNLQKGASVSYAYFAQIFRIHVLMVVIQFAKSLLCR